MLQRLADALRNRRIRISISCGRSTDYVDEYYITDMDGKVIQPWDFPGEWNGKVFQLIEEQDEQNKD